MTHHFAEKHVSQCLFKPKQVALCQKSSPRKRNPATLTCDGYKYTEYNKKTGKISIRFSTNKATSNEDNEGYALPSPEKFSPLQKNNYFVRPFKEKAYLTVSNKILPR